MIFQFSQKRRWKKKRLVTASHVPFTGKLTQKIVKLCRISRRTEAVTVNVKDKFDLESR